MSNLVSPYLYKIKCNDCQGFIYKEGLIPEFTCLVDASHHIEEGYLSVLTDTNMQRDCLKDYKQHRKDLIDLAIASGNQFTPDQLYYASSHFCMPKEVRDMFFSDMEQVDLGKLFHRRSTESRQLRWNNGLVTMYNYLSLADSFIVGREIELLAFRYLNYGVEGTSEGDEEGLFDYLTSASGTSYESTGLLSKSFEVVIPEMTMQDVSNAVMSILKSK